MVDFGILALVLIQIVIVGASVVVWLRMQSQLGVIPELKNDFKALRDVLHHRIEQASELATESAAIPAALKKRMDEIAAENGTTNRELGKLDSKLTSLQNKLAAMKRWESKPPPDEPEEDEDQPFVLHAQEEVKPVTRSFGRRKVG